MREVSAMREYRYPRGYREDEEMYVYDQCCANCAKHGSSCPFEDDVDRESTPGAKKKAMKEDAVMVEQELQWCIHWKQIKRHRF